MSNPFDELDEFNQRTAIDIAVAATLLVTRLPELGAESFEHIADQFALQYGVPHNIAKYALRNLGRELFHTGWQMVITKNIAGEVITEFTPGEPIVDTAV